VAEVGNKRVAGANGLCSRRENLTTVKERARVSVPSYVASGAGVVSERTYVHGVEAGEGLDYIKKARMKSGQTQ